MQKEHSPLDTTAARMAKLLEIALYTPQSQELQPDQAKKDLLSSRLAESSQDTLQQWKQIESLVARATREAKGPESGTLEACLTESITPLEQLEQIKTVAKREAAILPEGPARQVSLVLYHAAIAAGLTMHNVRITRLEPGPLGKTLGQFAQLSWITPRLKDLFTRAAQLCTDPD